MLNVMYISSTFSARLKFMKQVGLFWYMYCNVNLMLSNFQNYTAHFIDFMRKGYFHIKVLNILL